MHFQLTDVILLISIVQLALFALFLVLKRSRLISNKLLAFFLLIQIAIIINLELIVMKDYLPMGVVHFIHIGTPFYFLAAPVFFFYVKSRIEKDFRFIRRDLIHLLPFIVVLVFYCFTFYFYSGSEKLELLNSGLFGKYGKVFIYLYNALFTIQFMSYFIAELLILKKYRMELKQFYSSIEKINLSWLTYLIYWFIFAFLVNEAVIIIKVFIPGLADFVRFLDYLIFLILFNYIFYKGLTQPELFSGIEIKPKYVSSNLTKSQSEEYLSQLNSFMEERKPYLNSDLTLKDLADQISIPHRHLSQLINENLNQNFYDYISRYRINEAKNMLLADDNKTILEILFTVGFNSKSSFNTAFKKFTGTTPSHFKKAPKEKGV